MDLKDLPVILASGSPRRIEMLRNEGIDARVVKPMCGEELHIPLTPAQTVMSLAFRKAHWAVSRQSGLFPGLDDYLLLASDTIVFYNNTIIGKPVSKSHAREILTAMNGSMNEVYSGACIYIPRIKKYMLLCDRSEVYFKDIPQEVIDAYAESGEPLDKAGGYAVQGSFGVNIERIEGHVDNVIGFPLEVIKGKLKTVVL